MKKSFFRALISGLMFGIPAAQAFYVTPDQNCSTVDLRANFSWKMRNQGEISWCYAHAAADYLQFYQNLNVQISAADIAFGYNQRSFPRMLKWIFGGVVPETGFIRWALYDAAVKGYCPEDYFPSEFWSKRILQGQDRDQVIQVPIKKAIEEILSISQNVERGIYKTPSDLPYIYEFKEMPRQQFLDAVFFHSSGEVLMSIRSAACDVHRLPYPKIITNIAMKPAGRKTFQKINQVLDRSQPVTVDFFYGFLNNADEFPRSLAELHTTLLVGRRFNPDQGECQYLIKNSYGPDCSEYDRRHSCDAGYVWVGESSLYSAMTSFVYIRESEDDFTGKTSQVQDDLDFQSP